MSEIHLFAAVLLVIAAPAVGSFLGVVADRLPAGRPIADGRSACESCGHRLGVRDLVPVLSWLASRGRCRHCGERIGLRYPAIELAATVVAVWSLMVLPGWLAGAGAVLGWTLLTLAIIDRRHLVLPDALTLPLVVAGLALAWRIDPAKLIDHGIGALVGCSAIVAIAAAYRRWRKRAGIGFGDAKLFAAAGAWVGWQGLAGVLLVAAAAGLAVALIEACLAGRLAAERERPFGPYIAGALWLTWLYGPIMVL